jgi:hypothetical protein
MINLVDLYKKLKPPIRTGLEKQARFSACAIPGYTKHRLAKDSNNFPCLLIATQESSALKRPASIKLEHLEVLYDVNCRISHNDSLEDSRFTVICCKTQDISMQEYFLRTGNAIIELIGNSPTHKEIAKAVDNLVELFRVLKEAPRKSVQGLWAELFIISIASDPISLMRAWHRSPEDKYDFSFQNQRIEIKSATSLLRKHHFSLEQLNPPPEVKVLIASVIVERVGSGTSLIDLAEKVRAKINSEPNLLLYLEQMIGSTLGNNWRSASKDNFDIQIAKKSLNFFASESIPCIDPKIPKEISDIHFVVDITDVRSIDKKSLKQKEGLFKAASPK